MRNDDPEFSRAGQLKLFHGLEDNFHGTQPAPHFLLHDAQLFIRRFTRCDDPNLQQIGPQLVDLVAIRKRIDELFAVETSVDQQFHAAVSLGTLVYGPKSPQVEEVRPLGESLYSGKTARSLVAFLNNLRPSEKATRMRTHTSQRFWQLRRSRMLSAGSARKGLGSLGDRTSPPSWTS